jgi:hypothetical protein
MPRQKGVNPIEGTMGEETFYHSQDGYLVKKRTSLSGTQIKNDPNFARTRENMSEFANAGTSGKYLRDTVRPLMKTASDNRVSSRLVKVLTSILRLDTTDARGKRTVATGIATAAGRALLKGFEFNKRSELRSVLFRPYTLDLLTGKITIANLVPINDVDFPVGASHLTLRGAFAILDFVTGVSDTQYTNEENLPIDGTSTTVVLTPAAAPSGTGIKLYFLEIEFFQEVNLVQYALNNGVYNALMIIDVA